MLQYDNTFHPSKAELSDLQGVCRSFYFETMAQVMFIYSICPSRPLDHFSWGQVNAESGKRLIAGIHSKHLLHQLLVSELQPRQCLKE